MNTSVLPRSDDTYDLGSADYRWKNGYFSGFLDSNALKIDRLKILDTSYILRNVRWLHFDGESGYAVVQNSSSLNPSSVTVIALVKVLDYTRNVSYIFSKEGAYQLEIRPANKYIHFNRWIGGTKLWNYTYGGTLPSEGIIFLAATYDENWEKPKIYCNEQSLEVRGDEQSGALDSSTHDVYIAQKYTGAYKLCGDTYFFAEYNRPLDDTEIAQIRNYIMNGKGEMITDGLVLWYDGDSIDPANGIWRDKSGNGNDGIIYGATYQSIFDELTASDIPWGSVNSSILPISDDTYDLGSSDYRWKNGYFGSKVGIGVSSLDAGALQLPYCPVSGKTTLLIGDNTDMGSNSFELGIAVPSGENHWPFGITKAGTRVFGIDTDGRIANSLIPRPDNAIDLGSSSYRWKDIYFSGTLFGGVGDLSSLKIGGTEVIDNSRVLKNISSIDGFVGNTLTEIKGVYTDFTGYYGRGSAHIIPFAFDRLLFLTKRGGSVSADVSPTGGSLEAMFDAKGSFVYWDKTLLPVTITIELETAYSYMRDFMIYFYPRNAPKHFKVEFYDSSDTLLYSDEQTNWDRYAAVYHLYTPPDCYGTKKIKIYLYEANATDNYVHIFEVVWTYFGQNPFPFAVYKGGDTLYGQLESEEILPRTDNTYNLGSSSNRWKNLYLSGQIIGDKFQIKEVLVNTTSNRPSAGVQYRLFISTDEQIIYLDNGSEWIPLGAVYK